MNTNLNNIIGLFGTCGDSTWRNEISIPAIEAAGIESFNPVVENWTEDCMEIEAGHAATDKVIMLVITGETSAIGSMAESGWIALQAHLRGQKVFIVIGDMTDDGQWIAGTIASSRDRLNVDHLRYGDPTYVSPSFGQLVLLDVGSGEFTPILDNPAQTQGLTWSPDGGMLAFFVYENERQGLRLFDRASGAVRAVELDSDKEIATNSGLEWRPDGSGLLLDLRSAGWRESSRQAYLDLSEGPIIVQRGSDPFLDWDRVRNMGSLSIPAAVELPGGAVQELLPEGSYGAMEQSRDGRFLTAISQRPLKTIYEGNDGNEFAMIRVDLDTGDTLSLVEPSTGVLE